MQGVGSDDIRKVVKARESGRHWQQGGLLPLVAAISYYGYSSEERTRRQTPTDKPIRTVMATLKGTVRPPMSKNPSTYITAEEVLSQVLRKAPGKWLPSSSCLLISYQNITQNHPSINHVSIFLLLPTDQKKQVRSCFSKEEHLVAEEAMTLLQTTQEMGGMD